MRSIGKQRINELKNIIMDAWDDNMRIGTNAIVKKVPVPWWDIWEGAEVEIRRIITDELENLNGIMKNECDCISRTGVKQ